jgi:hypothetical protein
MKRIHGTSLVAAVILATAIFLIPRHGQAPTTGEPPVARHSPQKSRTAADDSVFKTHRRLPSINWGGLPELPPPVDSPYPPAAAESEEWIAGRVAELDRLAWFDDSESLHKILSELRNPLPEIRAAALAATLAFSSRESIPYLEAIARETRDPQEQKALTDAIEHLKLPTLIEELESQPTQPAPPEPDAP